LLRTISEIEGTRLAEAGEFTRRAFLNGKLDLVQAEALADLIEAETEAQRRMAVYAAEGHVSRQYERWRSQILRIQAAITADLDFGDEGDVPDSVAERVRQDIAEVHSELERHLASQGQAEIIRDGFRVAIIGRPNAGKSSLLNTLAGRDVAIVTDEPGTTRDLVEVSLDLGGLKIIVTDTAGIRENAGAVERIGIARALQSAKTANLVLLLRPDDDGGELTEAEWVDSISVLSKCDLGCVSGGKGGADIRVSALTGEGIDGLLEIIRAKAQQATDSVDLGPQRLRHRDALRRCAAALDRAQTVEMPLELRAEELRIAATELGRVTGRIDVEEVLGEVFRAFCIGK
jgi:tRNA modification GTPase